MPHRPQKTPRWTQWSEREARDTLAQLDRSPLSAAAFARSISVSIDRIRYWRARLAASRAPAEQAPFVPVRVVPAHAIKITVDAICIEIAADTAAERIADIVSAVAARRRSC